MSKKNQQYYESESKKAIESAIAQSEGKSLKDVRLSIRSAYPFELPRRGRAYKIWRKSVLEAESRLGLEPRKHKKAAQIKSASPDDSTPADFIASTVALRWQHAEAER